MIKLIEDNNVFEVLKLMNKSTEQNYYPFERNESRWITFLLNVIKEQNSNNPHYLAVGDYIDNKLKGFLLANSFVSHYNNSVIMDVKDCIIDSDNQNTYTVIRLYNYLMDHIRKHGGKRWRADSIRATEDYKYAKFLQLKYKADLFYSAHGTIGE